MQRTVSFSNTPTIKLPGIPLTKFSGNCEEWNNFKLQFNNLITSNSQLSQEQKLHYLNSSLTGPAKDFQSIDDIFDALFKALIDSKLDKQSRQYYESSLSSNEVPKLDDLISFLEKRAQILENIIKNAVVKPKPSLDRYEKPKTFFVKPNQVEGPCTICKLNHSIVKCEAFMKLTVDQRNQFATRNKLCLNCLSDQHFIKFCNSNSTCKESGCRHNTLLHRNGNTVHRNLPNVVSAQMAASNQKLNPNSGEFRSNVSLQDNIGHSFSCIDKTNKCTVLPTVEVRVLNHFNGSFLQARGILDSGSGKDIMTSDFANKLGLQEKTNFSVSGLGGNETKVKSILRATIQNGSGSDRISLYFLVVSKITDFLPIVTYNLENGTIPDNLADPQFTTPGKIDILIGAQSFFDIIKNDKIRSPNSGLMFRNTVFGYVASGAVNSSTPVQYCGFISQVQSIDDCLRKFWEVETITEPEKMLSEEEFREHHYKTTHERDETGRYILQMPVKDIEKLGESKAMAIERLDQLWKMQ
ncbi:hypothetical protein AVEN_160799-1 [Araneus ventricosus]|uniref:Uncharacterized protein n=1 Tax=Araneus ventricosus TaxID=182803 RepID=A0A4Y2HPX9_ARAVE|nr:hypothetical protein AVEN_160799-1 [Araneus ventricosus]